MDRKLTAAEMDAIAALVRQLVTGSADPAPLSESTGEIRFPKNDQGMSEEELLAFREKFLPQVA